MLSTSFTATCPLPSTLLGCHLPAPLHPPLPPRLCSLLCCQSSSTLCRHFVPSFALPTLLSDLLSMSLTTQAFRTTSSRHSELFDDSITEPKQTEYYDSAMEANWFGFGFLSPNIVHLFRFGHFGAEPAGRSLLNGFFKKSPIVGTLPGLIVQWNYSSRTKCSRILLV